jgi:hypothetical protein
MKRQQLEEFYLGDAAWEDSARIAMTQYWTDSPFQRQLLKTVGGDLNLAAMIYAKVGDGCLQWLDTPIPALSRRTPRSCLAETKLIIRLKTALMRMD